MRSYLGASLSVVMVALSGCEVNSGNSSNVPAGNGTKNNSSATSSIGDRYVLEITYNKAYQELPLSVADAESDGWKVSDDCVPGFGRRAHSEKFLDLWKGRSGALHLWYDRSGSIMGFGVSVESGVAEPWRHVDDHFEIDFLTRDPEAACGDGLPAEAGSVGDRLVMVGGTNVTTIPSTLQGAFDAKYNDGGPCFPEMGWHMMLNWDDVSSPTPVYSGADGGLLAMNLNSYVEQETPSFEYPQPKEGKAVFGWHVYFRDHRNACDGAPTAVGLPFVQTPVESEYTDFRCTPYFGQLWVQTLTTVVDLHASGKVCEPAGHDECTFVHYIGPNNKLGSGTPCVPPQQSDQCHCYHQVTYTEQCQELITSSNYSGSVAKTDQFNEEGVLKVCADDVVRNVVIGWGPSHDGKDFEICDCNAGADVIQV